MCSRCDAVAYTAPARDALLDVTACCIMPGVSGVAMRGVRLCGVAGASGVLCVPPLSSCLLMAVVGGGCLCESVCVCVRVSLVTVAVVCFLSRHWHDVRCSPRETS